jgi:hypothetical protein
LGFHRLKLVCHVVDFVFQIANRGVAGCGVSAQTAGSQCGGDGGGDEFFVYDFLSCDVNE